DRDHAISLGASLSDKAGHRLARLGEAHAVKIEPSINRVLAASKPSQLARIHVKPAAFEALAVVRRLEAHAFRHERAHLCSGGRVKIRGPALPFGSLLELARR